MVKRSPRLTCATSTMPAGIKNVLFFACFNVQTPYFYCVFLSGGCSGRRLGSFWAGLQAYEPHLSLTNRINAYSGLSVTFSFLFNFLLNTHIVSEGGGGFMC